ncbi:F0F1 ATP synthase subunit A [Roseiconus nitratireducens]|uniref:ATP synthase subunit a n=1 Tax=Roseiconus nitratireducens TaxID=2605748 RepID=A0A5M6DFK4_9BACT|nr:F0F1 ATP synthase subunit A [Roseiconus nitratireducens]KAA5545196.1 F0F1 ATP synthase subunit A [Roseiconus nitratireducens]
MNLIFASADDPLSHVVPHALHEEPLFTIPVGGGDIPALFIKDGQYSFYITNHLAMTFFAALAVILVFAYVAMKVRVKGEGLEAYQTKGRLAQLFETVCWFIRDEVARPNLHGLTDKYIPYIWTVFFFILFANVLGLVPFGYAFQLAGSIWTDHADHYSHWGGTATSNLSLNVMLALCSFIAVVFIGIRETSAKAFFSHFNPVGWDGPPAMSLGLGIPLYILEWVGLIIKCVVLAMRLFGTMMAGHLVVAAIVGLVFTAASVSHLLGYGVELAVIVGCIALMMLELFICLLQAFIFTFLTVLFISTTAADHGDHGDHHDPMSDESQMDLDKLTDPSRLAGLASS